MIFCPGCDEREKAAYKVVYELTIELVAPRARNAWIEKIREAAEKEHFCDDPECGSEICIALRLLIRALDEKEG